MVQFVITTLSNTAVYALIAVSLNVVYRSSGILNFGAGHLVAITGIFYVNQVGANAGGIAVTMVVGALVSLVGYLISVWWGQRAGFDVVALSLAMLGFGLLLDFAAGELWAKEGFSADPLIGGSITIGDTTFSRERVLVVVLALIWMGVVMLVVDRTMIGHAIEATSVDGELAQLYGVRTGVVRALCWMIGGAGLGLAGALQASISALSMTSALPLVVIGIAAAVVGGLGGVGKAAAGALVVAAVQTAFIQYVSPGYSVSMVFILLFLVLALRPAGLFVNSRVADRV
jgi:branched-chain amino acid transport system permease protein